MRQYVNMRQGKPSANVHFTQVPGSKIERPLRVADTCTLCTRPPWPVIGVPGEVPAIDQRLLKNGFVVTKFFSPSKCSEKSLLLKRIATVRSHLQNQPVTKRCSNMQQISPVQPTVTLEIAPQATFPGLPKLSAGRGSCRVHVVMLSESPMEAK